MEGSLHLGNGELAFRIKEVGLSLGPLDFDPLKVTDPNETRLVNYWTIKATSLVDVRHPLTDVFSLAFSIAPSTSHDFDGAIVLDPSLYACASDAYDLPTPSPFCETTPRVFHVPSAAADLAFLTGVDSSVEELSFQMSVFITGAPSLAHATDYSLCTLFSLAPQLTINATVLTVDISTGWHHFTLTATPSTSSLYINGSSVSTTPLPSAVSTASFLIHSLPSPYSFYLREVRLLSSLLSLSAIQLDTLNT